MALEYRNGRPYYYQKRRIGGRVVSCYMGSGPAALLMAQIDQADRASQLDQREARRRCAPPATPLELRLFVAFCQGMTRAALRSSGYHQHKGEWRMARTKQAALQQPAASLDNEALISTMKALTRLPADLRAEYQRRVDAGTLAPLTYNSFPAVVLLTLNQRMAQGVEWLELRGVGTVHKLRDSLTLDSDGPLELLLIEQIIACQMDHAYISMAYAQQEFTLNMLPKWQAALTASEGRYLRSIEALARVRKLAQRTPLQINIGGQQINTVTTGGPPPA
jgi:hypothetical protein